MHIDPFARRLITLALLVLGLLSPGLVVAATLEVSVQDPSGRPLTATLRLLAEEAAAEPLENRPGGWVLPALRLAEDGSARFDQLDTGRYRLRVEHPDFAAQTLRNVVVDLSDKRLEIKLTAGEELLATVIDRSGVPIANADATACESAAEPFGSESCRAASSDSDGRVRFENIAPGEVRVAASSEHHAWAQISLSKSQRQTLLQLHDGAPIEGRLRDRSGAPIPFTPIVIERIVRQKRFGRESVGPTLLTDAEGRFRHPGVSAGFYALRASRRGLHGFYSRAYAGRGGTTQVELSADPAASIEFALVDGNGDPLQVRVELTLDGRRKQDHYLEDALRLTHSSGIDGQVQIDHVPPTTTTLQIVPHGCIPIDIEPFAYQPGEHYKLGSLTTTPASTVQGWVEDNEGRPVGGATVYATMLIDEEMSSTIETRSDREGRFQFEHLSLAHAVTFQVQADGYDPAERTLDPGHERDELRDGVRLELQQRAGLFGIATTPDGRPLTRFRIRVQPSASPRSQPTSIGPRRWNQVEAEDGQFLLAPIHPGDYLLELEADGFAPGRLEAMVEERRLTDVGELQVQAGESLSGIVSDFAGVGISTALLEILELGSSTTSDGDGAFSFDGLEPGHWTFIVRHPEYAEFSERLPITEESFNRGVTITLGGGGSLRGRAVRDAQPVEVEVALRPQDGEVKPRTAATQGDGEFLFERLAPGGYQLSAYGPDGVSFVKPRWVTIVENDETSILLDADGEPKLRGQATLGGQPLPYASITFSRQTPVTDDIGSVSTDESGHYEMSLPELGRYRARIDGGGRILERVSFTVLNSGEQRQDFHLAGGSISGSVRDRDGEPVSAEVTALPVEQSLLEGSHRTRSSSDGRFELLALTPGSYRIAAQVQGQDSVEIGPIELRDQPLDGIELVLGDDKPLLRGRVVDPYGLAAANAFVLAIPSGQPNSALYANVASDLRGEFELRSPVNGAVDLIAFTTGFAPAVRRGWVARHDDPERLLMQLTEGATLNVRLLNATGSPIVGRFVSIEGLPPTTITATQSALATTMPSGPDGISRLRGLLPGRYRLRGPGIATADVDIGSGGESSIDLREPSSALSPAQ